MIAGLRSHVEQRTRGSFVAQCAQLLITASTQRLLYGFVFGVSNIGHLIQPGMLPVAAICPLLFKALA